MIWRLLQRHKDKRRFRELSARRAEILQMIKARKRKRDAHKHLERKVQIITAEMAALSHRLST